MFPILCRHAFVAVSASFSASTNTAIFALTAATCLMASSASSPARLQRGNRLVRLVELGVGLVELPPRVAPLGIQRDDVIHVLHALVAAALRLADELLRFVRTTGYAMVNVGSGGLARSRRKRRGAHRVKRALRGRHFAIARRWRARRTGRRRGERTGSPPLSVRNRLMSSIAAECEPRLCARCVEQCWAVSGDSDVYPMSAGTNSGGKTHVLRQEVTVAKWSVLKRTSTGLRRT